MAYYEARKATFGTVMSMLAFLTVTYILSYGPVARASGGMSTGGRAFVNGFYAPVIHLTDSRVGLPLKAWARWWAHF